MPCSVYNGRFSLRFDRAWVDEPQLLEDGRLVEKGMLVQQWPAVIPPLTQAAVQMAWDQDTTGRDEWMSEVNEIRPVSIEEDTWIFGQI